MSFTSLQFIFLFLPLAYAGFVLANRFGGTKQALNFLAMISLVFYAMWGVQLLLVLLVSMALNFTIGNTITKLGEGSSSAKKLLMGGVLANLAILGYLKYTNFFIDTINQLSGSSIWHMDIAVPIGVSFFTFVQIGYLIDAFNGQLIKHDLARYIVFAAFFPSVTAGPLVMQREMMEQLNTPKIEALDIRRVTIGLTMFGMGLFKKVMLADSIAPFADSVFNGAQSGLALNTGTAWVGALCYTLQLYFDFSGYSDMAIGLATIFGIKLPLNFDSPFKATTISDFWRRWHMTMTRFFTSYVYSGLAMYGMRKGMGLRANRASRFILAAALPSFFTFLCAGVWHGAGWTYVIYGAMHGAAIATYLAWREYSKFEFVKPLAWALTMLTVVCGLVMFRAPDVETAISLLSQMSGLAHTSASATAISIDMAQAISMIVILGAITLLLPNTQQVLHHEWHVVDTKPAEVAIDAGLVVWRPTFSAAILSACVFTMAITSIGSSSGFLYYKF